MVIVINSVICGSSLKDLVSLAALNIWLCVWLQPIVQLHWPISTLQNTELNIITAKIAFIFRILNTIEEFGIGYDQDCYNYKKCTG